MSVAVSIAPAVAVALAGDLTGARSAAPSLPPGVPPLPASAVEYWHGEFGASAAAAVGQILGTTLPAQGTPVVGPDPGFFNGRNVYQTTQAGGHFWFAFGLTALVATGARPWVYAVGRWRAVVGGAQQRLYGIGGSTAGQSEMDMQYTIAGVRRVSSGAGAWLVDNGNADTLVHRFKSWVVGATANLAIDDVVTTGPGAALATDINCAAIGSSTGVSGNIADGSVAFFLICSSKPTPAEEAALDVWAQTYWGATSQDDWLPGQLAIQGNPLTIQGAPIVIT